MNLLNKAKKIFATVVICTVFVAFNAYAEPMEYLNFSNFNDVIYYANGYVTWEELEKVLEGYNSLPEAVRTKLITNGAKIYVYPKKFETNKDINEQTVGLTRSLTKQVTVYNNGAYTIFMVIPPESYIYTDRLSVVGGIPLVHETGHIIDDLHCLEHIESYGASGSEEFLILSEKYKPVIAAYDKATATNAYSNNEIYAEAFRIMIENPGYLYQNAPELYQYMMKTIYY
ncbi:MAG: hypothetical protein K6A76_07865 [Oribacterium sp.]|nr:hypothetical protein [Oribacterium sp.]